jgi:hypothetical protein
MTRPGTKTNIIAVLLLAGILLFFCGCAGNSGTSTENQTARTTGQTEITSTTTVPAQSVPAVSLNAYETVYSRIDYAGDLEGKPAYIVTTRDNKKRILYDRKEIGSSYDQALLPAFIAGKLFYAGVRNNKYYAVYDGEGIGMDFFSIWSPGEYDGKPIYVAEKLGKSVLVYGGNEINNASYDYVWSYSLVGGKIAYLASKNGETYKKIVPQTSESGRDVPPEGVKSVLVYDGREIGREYDTVGFPMEVGGKLAYLALKGGKNFIVVGGLEGSVYDVIHKPLIIGGKLAYIAEKGGKIFLVYDGVETAAYDRIDYASLEDAGGKPAYRAADPGRKKGKYFMVYNGTEIGKEYDNVLSYAASGEKQAYVAELKTTRFVVYQGAGIGKDFDSVDPDSLAFYDGKLTFIAQKSGVWYIVSEE